MSAKSRIEALPLPMGQGATPPGARWVLLDGESRSKETGVIPEEKRMKGAEPPDIASSSAIVLGFRNPRSKLGVPSRAKGRGAMGILPPRLQLTPSVSHTYRFHVTATGSYGISVASLLGALGGICTIVNSKVVSWASAVKIKSVTLWPPGSTSASVNCQLAWLSGQSGQVPDESDDMSVPEGTTVSRALRFVPPPYSLAGFWIGDSDVAASVFEVIATAGAVIDLSVDYRLSNIITPTFSTVTVGVLGSVYYLALDGPGSNKIVPTGLPTTA